MPHDEKTKTVVLEPFLTEQWYLNVQPLADKAIAAVEKGETKFVPENWTNVYFGWMRNIRPWCISRQLWWGHQIPVWYDADGKIYCAETEDEAQSAGRRQDADPRRRRAGHLVLLGAVAVLDPGLAGQDAGAGRATIPPTCW